MTGEKGLQSLLPLRLGHAVPAVALKARGYILRVKVTELPVTTSVPVSCCPADPLD